MFVTLPLPPGSHLPYIQRMSGDRPLAKMGLCLEKNTWGREGLGERGNQVLGRQNESTAHRQAEIDSAQCGCSCLTHARRPRPHRTHPPTWKCPLAQRERCWKQLRTSSGASPIARYSGT